MRRPLRFFEAASALLFFGSLAGNGELRATGEQALRELQNRGYRVGASEAQIEVHPVSDALEGHQAGAWQPGVIRLREQPASSFSTSVYLRHELMHEAMHRTCTNDRPGWVDEAAAMSFSGEAAEPMNAPSTEDLERLRSAIAIDAPLDSRSYQTLRALVSSFSWPEEPCKVSERVASILSVRERIEDAPPSFLVMSVLSGAVLWSEGETKRRLPIGSLLKLPYVAALDRVDAEIPNELARSDTAALLSRREHFSFTEWKRIAAPLLSGAAREISLPETEEQLRELLGERGPEGKYRIVASLEEAGRAMRIALLVHPERFRGLDRNGSLEGSTLKDSPEELKSFLASMRALAKTGTAANAIDRPLVGHLLVAWPAEDPLYLAVFRAGRSRGAGVAEHVKPILAELRNRFPVSGGRVRLRALTRLPREAVEVSAPCAMLALPARDGHARSASVCGVVELKTSVPSARGRRFFRGVLEDGDALVLETDPASYSEEVLRAEASDLRGEAREALRAVIAFDGAHGMLRHPAHGSVCDTTHCMVTLGAKTEKEATRPPRAPRPELLKLLSKIAGRRGDNWFEFSKAGEEHWSRSIPLGELARVFKEDLVTNVERRRLKAGEVEITLQYRDGLETVSCEAFRNALHLLSCPEEIRVVGPDVELRGIGEGHGRGLGVEQMKRDSRGGADARSILLRAYDER